MQIEDKAERLHALIEKLQHYAAHTSMVNKLATQSSGNVHSLNALQLWQTMGRLAEELGMADDRELRNSFESLCASVQAEIQGIPIRKESVRTTWAARIASISLVFSADNFAKSTQEAFKKHFTSSNLEALDAISERFRAAGLKESSDAELKEALAAVRETIEAITSSGGLDARIAAVLSHYLQQMETVYAQASDFGDEVFWKIYKETFATFAQIHPIIAELENADEVKGKLQVVFQKLTSKSIAGVSLAANLATLGATLYPLLG
ncbi:hypothetical protein M2418_000430 [Rhizobium sp. BIGb0125]|uniref:hypothetical protein n=1 Tax=Rhizobium sp. BIGb0125 TaxID=2940618 RepID=UPI002169D21B|nr:hypothetical protein [Rhizobium sp. BIGb0125]MCS4240928.1 hypothetical protein [Rhizobium sp. BIGb0125]